MVDATAIQTEAFLRRTAIGAFADPATGTVQPTRMFTLAESGAGMGTTLIVTVADLLAFGRMHLNGGNAPSGKRVLAAESVAAMQTVTFDPGGPPSPPPVGLGWWLVPIAGTIVPWHAGGSPGGSSGFCILPDYDAVVASFVAGGTSERHLHDLLHNAVIEELTGGPIAPTFELEPAPPADEIFGDYGSLEVRRRVERDEDGITVTQTVVPSDEYGVHRRSIAEYNPGALSANAAPYVSISSNLFAPAGNDFPEQDGFTQRLLLLTYRPAGPGRPAGLQQTTAFYPRVERG
jgi:CubicO group peptidase (beta-lactamase class C family)